LLLLSLVAGLLKRNFAVSDNTIFTGSRAAFSCSVACLLAVVVEEAVQLVHGIISLHTKY